MKSAFVELAERVAQPGKLARLGQALWMKIGRTLEKKELFWATSLLGDGGDEILWECLREFRVVVEQGGVASSKDLAWLLGALAGQEGGANEPRMVWTLPAPLNDVVEAESYSTAIAELVETAESSIEIITPYLEAKGVGALLDMLLGALNRGVGVTVVTHGVQDVASRASLALEDLHRNAVGLRGRLLIYSASKNGNALLHSKIVVQDRSQMIVGSANFTSAGLGSSLEAGVVLGGKPVFKVCQIIDALCNSYLVEKVIKNR